MRILLVDDEPKLLEGLKRSLRMERPSWEVVIAASGELALACLAQEPFDVVVTELLMPGLDGRALLRAVQQSRPATIRIVLSGQPRLDLLETAEGSFHRFLAKPLDPEILVGVLEELALSGEDGEQARSFVAGLHGIPSLPVIYAEIRRLLDQEDVPMKQLVGLVQRDLGIASKLLKLVNSAYFSLDRKVTDLSQAISMLGIETVKTVVLVRGVLHALKTLHPSGIDMNHIWKHSQEVANGMRCLASGEGLSPAIVEDAYSLGLLHDLGRVVMALDPRVEYGEVLADARASGQAVAGVEKRLFGADHAAVGAHVLGLWGLPKDFCLRIREHHSPSLPLPGFPAGLALHVADAWSRLREPGDRFQENPVDPRILAYGDPTRPARWEAFFARGTAEEAPASPDL